MSPLGASRPWALLLDSPSAALIVTDGLQVRVLHPKPALCQLIMLRVLVRAVQRPRHPLCLQLHRHLPALSSGRLCSRNLSAVLACLQAWGFQQSMQTLLLLWPSVCICDAAAVLAALQAWRRAPPLLLVSTMAAVAQPVHKLLFWRPTLGSMPHAATLSRRAGTVSATPASAIGPQQLCLSPCRHGWAASHAASLCWRRAARPWDDAVRCPAGSARPLHGRPSRLWSASRQVAVVASLLGLASGPLGASLCFTSETDCCDSASCSASPSAGVCNKVC